MCEGCLRCLWVCGCEGTLLEGGESRNNDDDLS